MKRILILMILLIFSEMHASNDYFAEKVQKATKLYENNQTTSSREIFEEIYKEFKINNGYLFFNIGTCYLKENMLGKSLYWFAKAKSLIPLNSSLNKNIQIASSKTKDMIEDTTYIKYLERLFFVSYILSLKNILYIGTALFYLLIICLILLTLFYKSRLKIIFIRGGIVSGIFFIFFLLNFFWDYYKLNFIKIGYITNNNVEIKSDFNEKSDTVAVVNDGTKVILYNHVENFVKIKLSNNVTGWIRSSNLIY